MLSRVIATLFLATGLAWLAACASPGLPNQGGTYIAVPAEVAASTPRRLPKAAPQQAAFNYPVDALRDRLTGKVLLQFRIDANGNVQSAQVIAADAAPILREAALNYLRRQTFSSLVPALIQPIRLHFVLRSSTASLAAQMWRHCPAVSR
jgi:TonB family protein